MEQKSCSNMLEFEPLWTTEICHKVFFCFFFTVYVGLLNCDKSNNHNYFGKTLIVQHDCSVSLHKSNLFIPIML